MALGIEFNNIPGSGLVAPIITFELTSGGSFESTARLLVVGFVNADSPIAIGTPGDPIALDTPMVVSGHAEVQSLAGAGSMLEDKYRIARQNAPAQEIWIMGIADVGTEGTWKITVDSAPPAGVGTVEIGGDAVQVTVGTGDTEEDVAAAIADAINNYYNELYQITLPVTAVASLAVADVTARHKGEIFNNLDFFLPESGNVFYDTVTITVGVPATGDPDTSGGLAALGDIQFDYQSWTFSDALNMQRYEDAMSDVSGRWSWARQSYGHIATAFTGSISETTTAGLGEEDRHKSMVWHAAATPSAPWRWECAQFALQVPWLEDGANGNVSRNQTGRVVFGLRPPRDPNVWPDYATLNTLNKSNTSTWGVSPSGDVTLHKWVTMSRLNAAALPDTTFRDIQSMAQVMYSFRRFRTMLFDEHGQKAIADSNPTDMGALTTPEDITATMDRATRTMPGVLEGGRFIVERDVENANRVNILAALDRVNPLDVIAANGKLYNAFNAANGLAAA